MKGLIELPLWLGLYRNDQRKCSSLNIKVPAYLHDEIKQEAGFRSQITSHVTNVMINKHRALSSLNSSLNSPNAERSRPLTLP